MSAGTITSSRNERVLDHIKVCAGDLTCKKCGRRGCGGCISRNSELCVICARKWSEDGINLYPPNSGDWDSKENRRIT